MEYVIIGILVLGFAGVIWQMRKNTKPQDAGSFSLLNQNIQGIQTRIDKTTESLNARLDNAARVIGDVNKELGQVKEMGRNMRDLQDFLRSPKLRGNIGEQVMKDLLEQYFSREHFDLQFKFKSGNIVDAILRTDKGLIAIDAKFPLENFKRLAKAEEEQERASARHDFVMDVRKHIQDISRKYILPDEQTVDFAIMYIPAESIYYEIIHDDSDLHAYAHDKRVFPVSPNSFYYFLRVILLGMEGKRIEEASKKILEMLNAIQGDAKRFGDNLGVLNTHITNAKGALDRVNTEYGRLSGKIDQVRMLK